MFRTFAKTAALLLCVVTLSAGIQAQGPNLLTNPGFELGTFTGYGIFTNAYVEMTSLPQFEPHTGNYMCSIFGGFWGVFNTSGIFQSFNALEGEVYEMDCYSRHWSGDALIGAGAPASNSVLMRIAFFDAAGQEIPNSGADRVILDGTFATDVWHDNMPVRAVAPAGTVAVQPLIIYLQPGLDPGAVHVDDLEFRRAFGLDLSQDTNTLDLTIVTDAPMAGVIDDVLRVEFSDPQAPTRDVPVRGLALDPPVIGTSSQALAFGDVHVFRTPGATAMLPLIVSNTGGSTLTVSTVGLMPPVGPHLTGPP